MFLLFRAASDFSMLHSSSMPEKAGGRSATCYIILHSSRDNCCCIGLAVLSTAAPPDHIYYRRTAAVCTSVPILLYVSRHTSSATLVVLEVESAPVVAGYRVTGRCCVP